MLPRLVIPIMVVVAVILGTPAGRIAAQIDPQVRDRVVPAIVEIALDIDMTENGTTSAQYLPVGSGTIVSPDGFVLTNWHVVDMDAHRADLDAWEAQAVEDGKSLTFVLNEDRVLLLGTDGTGVPQPTYIAEVVAKDHALDLAVLRITGDGFGASLPDMGALPFVPLGDSATVRQGDPLDLFGYPMIGGDTLTYTNGVVSGFLYEEGIDGPAWITTNATMSGGSSGGTALDRTGRHIGIPTQGTELDCRPGDTNGDGTIDAEDVGCIPMGGSIGQLRPINLAKPILAEAGWVPGAEEDVLTPVTVPTPPPPTEVPKPPAPTAVPSESTARETVIPGTGTEVEPEADVRKDFSGDVPMYLGNPARTGEMPGPDPVGRIGELWRVETGKDVYSSPAVVDGMVYIGTGWGADTIGAVLALDAATGEEVWRFEGSEGSGFPSSPAVAHGTVYVGSNDFYLYALNASDGKLIRQFAPAGWTACGAVASPLITGTTLLASFLCALEGSISDTGILVNMDVVVVAFDSMTGTELWQFHSNNSSVLNSPAMSEGILVVNTVDKDDYSAGTVYGLDAATGSEIWHFSATTGFIASPVIDAGLVFVKGRSGDLFALDLNSGLERWRVGTGGEVSATTLAVADGVVYVTGGDRRFYTLDANTGEEIGTPSLRPDIISPLAVTAISVYAVDNHGVLVAVERFGDYFEDLAQLQRDDRAYSDGQVNVEFWYVSPVVSDGRIFVVDGTGALNAYGYVRVGGSITENMSVVVVGDGTSVRAAPSSASVSRAELQGGARLQIIGSSEEREGQPWWPVQTEGGRTGWVPESAIDAPEVSASVPAGTYDGVVLPEEEEADCATGAIYPVNTDLIVERDAVLLMPDGGPDKAVPAGTLVRTTGPFVENGPCDLWPVVAVDPSTLGEGLIDERVLAPANPGD